MTEPEVITLMRKAIESDSMFGATVTTDGPFPKIGIRPELLTEQPDGRRVWRVNPKQCRKVIAQWDAVERSVANTKAARTRPPTNPEDGE